MYKYSDCISTCLLLSGPSVAPADAEPGWSMQEMKVHRIMIQFGIWGVQSSQGSAAAPREDFALMGRVLPWMLWGRSAAASPPVPCSRLCCAAAPQLSQQTHPRLGRSDSPGDDFISKSLFFLRFWVQLASGFLSARWAAVLEVSWAAQELWVFLLILLPVVVFFFFIPIKGNQ